MKYPIKILAILLSICCFGQNVKEEIKLIEGIWIAEDYYNSFEKTKSAVKSKDAFDFFSPVAIRINSAEIKKGILNIGYARLHDHLLHPEVSDYTIKNNDTIREFSFKIDLNKKDSLGYYKTTHIGYYFSECISYISWNANEPSLTLYIPKGDDYDEEFIKYKRVESEFQDNYPFPNPLYYYTRRNTLIGNYTIKDATGIVLSENFQINDKGISNGYEKFENFTFYFSTDIYCGLPHKSDFLIVVENILDQESEGFVFLIDIKDNGDISLHKRKTNSEERYYELGEKVYELIKN